MQYVLLNEYLYLKYIFIILYSEHHQLGSVRCCMTAKRPATKVAGRFVRGGNTVVAKGKRSGLFGYHQLRFWLPLRMTYL